MCFLFILKKNIHTINGDSMIINDSKVQEKLKENAKNKSKLKNILLAFFFGGLLGIMAQGIYLLFNNVAHISEDNSTILTSAFFIFIAFLLTCFGVFDKIALIAHSGVLIPITGFANSITSCALEGKAEGLIFGIGAKMFSLIGCVCTYGIVSSIFLGIIYYLIQVI